jgi:hypothetical protein
MASKLRISLLDLPARSSKPSAREVSSIFGGCLEFGATCDPSNDQCCYPTVGCRLYSGRYCCIPQSGGSVTG